MAELLVNWGAGGWPNVVRIGWELVWGAGNLVLERTPLLRDRTVY